MDIDVIIPIYNGKKTIKRALYSIAYQKNSKHFHVYLINDCDSKTYEEEINLFKDNLDIKELKLPANGGPGVARQYGIDNSNSKYIVFIDADDYFYSPFAINNMYQFITSDDSDLLISNFIYERDNEVLVKKRNNIWLHGKMYKREFLEKKNIRFNNTRANEDNGFNRLILLCGAKTSYLDEITYVYSENVESITRKENRKYKFTGLEWYVYNMVWSIDESLKRGVNSKDIHNVALNVLVSMYFYYLDLYDEYDVSQFFLWCKDIKKIYMKYGDVTKDKSIIKYLIKQYATIDYKDKELNYIIDFEKFMQLIGDV